MHEQTSCAHSSSQSAFIVALLLIKCAKSKLYYRIPKEGVSVQKGTLCQTDGIVAAVNSNQVSSQTCLEGAHTHPSHCDPATLLMEIELYTTQEGANDG